MVTRVLFMMVTMGEHMLLHCGIGIPRVRSAGGADMTREKGNKTGLERFHNDIRPTSELRPKSRAARFATMLISWL